MAAFTGFDLKMWREAQGISAADLAERISCDTGTIYRYESGKIKPNPDVMYEMCVELGNPDKWTSWMRTEFPASYGRVHPETAGYELSGALMSMFAEMDDVLRIQTAAMRDGANGEIDDIELKNKILVEVTEMMQSAQRVRTLLKGR